MKTLFALILFSATAAHAHLINLTPGGWNMTQNGLPPGFERTFKHTFFDEATPNGWVSQFGRINGGTYFFTDLIGNPGTQTNVWWDFTGQPEGFFLTTVTLFGFADNGDAWMSIYKVPKHDHFQSL
jgi:hypothetical protein